jgi:hypothetical protein
MESGMPSFDRRDLTAESVLPVGGDRRLASSGNPSREEPQGLLAHGENHCQWSRDDEQVAAGAGTGEPEESLGVTRSASLNRQVRTRMPRWCGEGGQKWPPLPDSVAFSVFANPC